ncbi:MAG: penicillin-binding protein [Chloroflexi bacterium]|nr:MAG: penicillin-binding protein [Chloroflexota bacterium]
MQRDRLARQLLIRGAAVLVALAVAGTVLLFITTPSGSDIEGLTARVAREHHVTLLQAGEVPPQLADLLVATEDERFYQHHGIDVIGIARALLNDFQRACFCEGGSTLTQQLVKQTYLDGSDLGLNKLRGMALAFKVETVIGKRQILADYLSITPFGFGLFGASAASCAYFHRPLGELDLAQYALLAGLPQAPVAYDPRTHPDLAVQRRSQVLGRGVSEGYITRAEADAANAEPLLAAGSSC